MHACLTAVNDSVSTVSSSTLQSYLLHSVRPSTVLAVSVPIHSYDPDLSSNVVTYRSLINGTSTVLDLAVGLNWFYFTTMVDGMYFLVVDRRAADLVNVQLWLQPSVCLQLPLVHDSRQVNAYCPSLSALSPPHRIASIHHFTDAAAPHSSVHVCPCLLALPSPFHSATASPHVQHPLLSRLNGIEI